MSERVWDCKFVGEADALPDGADAPMRQAVAKAFREMTGNAPKAIFSGWGGTLAERERAAIEDRDPVPSPKLELPREVLEAMKWADQPLDRCIEKDLPALKAFHVLAAFIRRIAGEGA